MSYSRNESMHEAQIAQTAACVLAEVYSDWAADIPKWAEPFGIYTHNCFQGHCTGAQVQITVIPLCFLFAKYYSPHRHLLHSKSVHFKATVEAPEAPSMHTVTLSSLNPSRGLQRSASHKKPDRRTLRSCIHGVQRRSTWQWRCPSLAWRTVVRQAEL